MSCPPSQSINPDRPAPSADAGSSDYGSDFSPEEEELLNELLDQVATTPASPTTATRPPPPPRSPSQQTFTSTTAVLGDIEDYNGDPASGRVPRVLGRQMPPWQVAKLRTPNARTTVWSPGRANPNPGYGAGKAFGNIPALPPPLSLPLPP